LRIFSAKLLRGYIRKDIKYVYKEVVERFIRSVDSMEYVPPTLKRIKERLE